MKYLQQLHPEHIAKSESYDLGTEPNGTVSTLGMLWNTASDVLSVQVRLPQHIENLRTKRQVSGCIAKVYDP
ncbi:transposon polyprotein [Anopheles sinensis]|uniref:Transposon polyprotein n=1 Tax=Anopheles sinensis TaxID=74873 RepID=A0A084VAI3_ANOSI|nr:transposon polyprotein [Anopheles sinensis]